MLGHAWPFLGTDASVLDYTVVAVEAMGLFLASHFTRYVLKYHWIQRPIKRVIPLVVGLIIIVAIPIYPIKLGYSSLVGLEVTTADRVLGEIIGHILNYTFFLTIWTILYFTYHYFERYSQSLKYEAAMREIELAHLKSQLNPHFIFNALNSIRALVDENPLRSKEAINQLSNILRNSLAGDKDKLTKFEDELETVKDYLALESTRFEERLETKFDIHPQSFQYLVPPLMLQTLVENGIKHGIGSLKEGGTIKLSTFVEDNLMHIHIRNSGQLNGRPRKKGTGLGLKNTRKRLDLIFGDSATFNIFNENDHTVLAVVTIPIIKQYESTYY